MGYSIVIGIFTRWKAMTEREQKQFLFIIAIILVMIWVVRNG
jgi:flagellar biogenesis protein FliO